MLAINEGTERVSIPSRGISGSALKLIAIVTMLVDHVGAALIEVGILCTYDWPRFTLIMQTDRGMFWYQVDTVCRTVGRVSFPIFCFLLVEGFVHTRNLKRYTINMFLFALVSEIPFDMAFQRVYFGFDSQNVFFTLFIGLLVLNGLRRFQEKEYVRLLVIALGCAAAYVLHTDYDIFGILLITALYMLREDRRKTCLIGGLMMIYESFSYFCSGALAFIPIWFYNGTRGKIKLKYFFYCFYPAHLILLYLIRTFVMRL